MMILLSCSAFYEESITETFNWIDMVSIVGGYLRQIKDNLYSYILRSCHSSK